MLDDKYVVEVRGFGLISRDDESTDAWVAGIFKALAHAPKEAQDAIYSVMWVLALHPHRLNEFAELVAEIGYEDAAGRLAAEWFENKQHVLEAKKELGL